jgi:hypothetical protein
MRSQEPGIALQAAGRTLNLRAACSGVSAKILTHLYPQTENNDVRIDRIAKRSLIARALTVKDGVVTARIDGFVMMHDAFYPVARTLTH